MVIEDFPAKTMEYEKMDGSYLNELDGASKFVKSLLPGLKCLANKPQSPTDSVNEFMKGETAFITKQRCESGVNVCSPTKEKFLRFETAIINKPCAEPEVKACTTTEEKFMKVESAVVTQPHTEPGVKVCSTTEDDDNTYTFTHGRRGLAVIINNVDFSKAGGFGDRAGSDVDAANLRESLTELGFDILCLRNVSAVQMVNQLLLAARKYEHDDADCFVCVVLSHGEESYTQKSDINNLPHHRTERKDLLFGVDGKSVPTKYVVEMFNDDQCPGLKDKPRLFFFQACRGGKVDDGATVNVVPNVVATSCVHHHHRAEHDSHSSNTDSTQYLPLQMAGLQMCQPTNLPQESVGSIDSVKAVEPVLVNPYPDTLYKDCLLMHATPPGHLSWRDPVEGSWFIQSLCQVLNCNELKSGRMTLSKALTLVCRLVAFGYESFNPTDRSYHRKKEEPVIYSMLVKDVVMKTKDKQSMFFT
ncbi:Caspase-3 [Bulinus truncatus]|nr:Caspase-3 [Bulinus truncatus]